VTYVLYKPQRFQDHTHSDGKMLNWQEGSEDHTQ
jgi:hypothetical protein